MNTKSNNTNKSVKIFAHNKNKWGIAVCFGTIITFIAGIGHINSFGLIYRDFIADTHSSAKSLTTAHGVFAVMLAIGGLILNVCSRRCSLRLGGMIGASLLSLGSFATIFITSTTQLPLTFGLLQGIGFGMIVPVCYSTINHYFIRKRTQVMSLIKATQGIILIWYPQLLRIFLSHYGFRGTLLIISGISLHTFPGMATMVTDFDLNRPANKKKRALKNEDKSPENVDLLGKANHSNATQNKNKTDKRSSTKFGLEILEILNVKILKDPVFCNICVGQSFVNFSDLIFFVLLPMLLFQYGFDTSQVAACISISAGADVAGRFGLAFISSIVPINIRILYYLATFFTLGSRIVILQVRQFVWVAVATVVLGVLRAWLHVASPLVISAHVKHEDFTGAYALFMLSAGIVNVTCSPAIGIIKDLYQDYIPAFYTLTACCVPCLIFWPIEYFLYRNQRLDSPITV